MLGSSVCSDPFGTNCRGRLGQGTSIWIVPSSQQSRESQPGTALSSPGQRGRQPQRSQQNHRPPGQWALLLSRLGLAPSVLLPESKKAFLCCFWQEEFSKDNLMGSTSQQTAAAGDSSTWKVHLPSDASQSLTYIPISTKRQATWLLQITGKH